jgi:putative transport protein
MENQTKKSKKWIWLIVTIAIVGLLVAWCVINDVKIIGAKNPDKNLSQTDTFNFNSTFVLFATAFLIITLGYLLGAIDIKGVSLGTAGVFLVAILVGFLTTLDFGEVPLLGAFHVESEKDAIVSTFKGPIQNIGLILFVGAVGFIAGPNFFKNLKKNFKTYILLGLVIILVGTIVTVICILLTDYGPEYWSGVLSGALTSTPGFSAAKDAVAGATNQGDLEALITLGHAIAYPFGVVGVVLFVQILPKLLKADMQKEREFLRIDGEAKVESNKKLFLGDPFGLTAFALAVVFGLLLGSITIPLSGKGFDGPCFSLGTTGGVLIGCLLFGHFGRIGKLSLKIPENTLKVLKEFGLMFFLLGAGFHGGVSLVEQVSKYGGGIVVWGLLGGAVMTTAPMLVGFILAKKALKLPLLNNLGSITGGMTSTPALGALINVSKSDDVASSYAATYPIALVLIVLVSQFLIILL